MGPFPMPCAKKIPHHVTTICQVKILRNKKPQGFALKLGKTPI